LPAEILQKIGGLLKQEDQSNFQEIFDEAMDWQNKLLLTPSQYGLLEMQKNLPKKLQNFPQGYVSLRKGLDLFLQENIDVLLDKKFQGSESSPEYAIARQKLGLLNAAIHARSPEHLIARVKSYLSEAQFQILLEWKEELDALETFPARNEDRIVTVINSTRVIATILFLLALTGWVVGVYYLDKNVCPPHYKKNVPLEVCEGPEGTEVPGNFTPFLGVMIAGIAACVLIVIPAYISVLFCGLRERCIPDRLLLKRPDPRSLEREFRGSICSRSEGESELLADVLQLVREKLSQRGHPIAIDVIP
jgi:hypothetical protein